MELTPADRAIAMYDSMIAATGYPRDEKVVRAITRCYEDEAGLDVAWKAAEDALPEDWELELKTGGQGRRDLFFATASYCYGLRYYRANVGPARSIPSEMEFGPDPAAALHALAARLSKVPA